MQLVSNGPDIPDSLLRAHEDGDVVFFCGAGISYPAGLPSFAGLAHGLYSALGVTTPSAVQQTALRKKQYDTAIGLLEQDIGGGRQRVRTQIAQALTAARPGEVATHDSLLTLARNKDNKTRLITTNFDRLFESICKSGGRAVNHYKAPLLPVPKNQWDGLVYLHGLLPEPVAGNESELEHIVVSSGDFGRAYLIERWAARFVAELFRAYTVCFVGYSIEDPVLRYMMDALAADRLLGESPIQAYAFGDYSTRSKERTREEWAAKNVVPILYRRDKTHSYLHRTLQEWAGLYKDGITGKESVIVKYASTQPQKSTQQDDYVGRLLWAISAPSGIPARKFADLDPTPSLEWLEAFSEMRYGYSHLRTFEVAPKEPEDKKLAFSLISRPTPYALAPFMRIADSGAFARWDHVMSALGYWLTKHLPDPRLLLWIIRTGGEPHPNFVSQISQALRNSKVDQPLALLWRLLLAGRLRIREPRVNIYSWTGRLKEEGFSLTVRLQLLEILTPHVALAEAFRYGPSLSKLKNSKSQLKELVNWEIVLGADYIHHATKDLRSNETWKAALVQILSELTSLLNDALDLMQALGEASELTDASYLTWPSIEDHPQNTDYREWTALIGLLRDAWLLRLKAAPAKAKAEVERWQTIEYPLFRRFVLFAASHSELFSPTQSLDLLLAQDAWWLWSTETRREALQLLTKLAESLGDEHVLHLERKILLGPPDTMYRQDADPALLERVSDTEIVLRLNLLRTAGRDLSPQTQKTLNELSLKYPGWKPGEDERDMFPFWVSSGFGEAPNIRVPEDKVELIGWLKAHPKRIDAQADNWFEYCQQNLETPASALLELAAHDDWSVVERWRTALQAWGTEKDAGPSWELLGRIISEAPDYVIAELAPALGWWLQAVSKVMGPDPGVFFKLALRLLRSYANLAVAPQKMDLGDILNHPVGLALLATFNWWYRQNLQDGQGLTDVVRPVFDEVIKREVPAYRPGRAILSMNVIALFRVDATWTKEHLLPCFDWKAPQSEALFAWKGFLQAPRLHPPLIAALNSQFLATADHYAMLKDSAQQYAAFLAYAALELREGISATEFAMALQKLPFEGLVQAIRAVTNALEAAGDKRQAYWVNRVAPFFKSVWPKSLKFNSEEVSRAIARLCLMTQQAFPAVLKELGGYLQRIERPDEMVLLLQQEKLHESHPEAALAFLDKIVGDDARFISPDNLESCLDTIVKVRPALDVDRRLIRLREIRRRQLF